MLWDVFISHASEDKAEVARPLAERLRLAGLRVWIDEAQLKLGDSLRAKIDEGLAQSRYGVVILSPEFFAKQWPQRELGALFSKPNAILPVWHKLSSSQIAMVSPLLADLIAASTDDGIDSVVDRILEIAGSRSRPERHYTASVALSPRRVERALEVIETLSSPSTWRQMETTAPGYPAEGWMGSASETMIEVVYGFMMPLVQYRQVAYAARRNLALLDARSRMHLALLETGLEALCNESGLATMEPAVPYTPRVPDWRAKRQENPQRYWWQGISPERFEEGVPFFLRRPAPESGDPFVTSEEFAEFYRSVYNCSDSRLQQSLGILANGFHDFRPDRRPVLWRVCVCLARIYAVILGNTAFDPDSDPAGRLHLLLEPARSEEFPFALPGPVAELYEPYATTLAATGEYLREFALPRVRAALLAARE